MSNKSIEKCVREGYRQTYIEQEESKLPPNVNTKEYKKEKLIDALVKELGSSRDKPKRIRKIVNKYY